jgi:hypothetical protein
MTRKIVALADTKKKPSVLLVYLILDRYGRTRTLNRQQIIAKIKEEFGGITVEPKTVSDAAGIFKSLSVGEHPFLDFHQEGKNGYRLGNCHSPLSKAEVVRMLASFEQTSSAVADNLLERLRPYLSDEDAAVVQQVRWHNTTETPSKDLESSLYISNLEKILQAFETHHEIHFSHRFASEGGTPLCTPAFISLTPLRLYAKNDRLYFLGGLVNDQISKEQTQKASCLYLADVKHMNWVTVSPNASLPESDFLSDNSFDFYRYARFHPYVQEGRVINWELGRGYEVRIDDPRIMLATKITYGDCVTVTRAEKDWEQHRRYYYVTLRLPLDTLFAWLFENAKSVELLGSEDVKQAFIDRANQVLTRFSDKAKDKRQEQ